MRIIISSYIAGSSPVHTCDARVKVVLLLAYSITLFLVHTWLGIALCAMVFTLLLYGAALSPKKLFAPLVAVYIIMAASLLFNSFSFDIFQAQPAAPALLPGEGFMSKSTSYLPIPFFGSFGFLPGGFLRGCFFALRIFLLIVASLLLCYTTSSNELIDALESFLRPLRVFHVPVDDVAMVFSLALRFIPVTAEEFSRVYNAQLSRGAHFGEGSLWVRLHAWQSVMIPLFVGLFRRADVLAVAMEARCYGAQGLRRSALVVVHFTMKSVGVLVGGVMLCAVLGSLL